MYDLDVFVSALQEHSLLMNAPSYHLSVSDVSYDSRDVKPGTLFVCKGLNFKPEYLDTAIQNGAVAYVSEKDYGKEIPVLLVSDVRQALSIIAMTYYGHPSDGFNLIGITGTKGKTTTTYMVKSILDARKQAPTAVLSTVEMFTGERSVEAHLTTPESLDLQKAFSETRSHNLSELVMEVSSQAYKQERVFGQHFNIALFLNISEDHIGPLEHRDFEDYFNCKLELLKNADIAVLNAKSDCFERIYDMAKQHAKKVITYGTPDADYQVVEIQKANPGFSFTVHFHGVSRSFSIALDGRFNIDNALAAVIVADCCNASDEAIREGLLQVFVPGRMNRFDSDGRIVFVDYAHNLLSFTELFKSLKTDYPDYRIKVITGCPGHKNMKRRIDIGHLCGQYANYVYLTAEDPGFENPTDICNEMASYIREKHENYIIIPDRKTAILAALEELLPKEILIIAGKGEEDYQKVEGRYDYYEGDLALTRHFFDGLE